MLRRPGRGAMRSRFGRTRFRRPQLKRPSLNRMLPNILTVAALCAGLSSIRFGLIGRWEPAVLAIIAAVILDGLDGRLARLLGGTSRFGAELDSLSDFVSFGVAPAVLLYLWSVQGMGGFGWAVVLLLAVCCALRLARFNTALDDSSPPPWSRHYFVGIPAPAGAGLALLPMMVSFELGPGIADRPIVVAAVMVAVALLMVSRVPTYSIKSTRLPQEYPLATLILVGVVVASLVSDPWITFITMGALYSASIPLSVWTSARARRGAADLAAGAGLGTPLSPPALPAVESGHTNPAAADPLSAARQPEN